MTSKQVGEFIVSVIYITLILTFCTAFVNWSKTWGWESYAYTMFYSGIGIFIMTMFIAIATGMFSDIWKVIVAVCDVE